MPSPDLRVIPGGKPEQGHTCNLGVPCPDPLHKLWDEHLLDCPNCDTEGGGMCDVFYSLGDSRA